MEAQTKIIEAVKCLKSGGIIIFPTDTAFGIGCAIDKNNSVKKLFELRRRPQTQAVPVLVDSLNMAEKFWLSPIPNNVRHLIKDHWPGSLTIIYNCNQAIVNPLVRGNGKTLGIRMPNHEIILEIIKKAGVPILGPSANFHDQPTPYHLKDLNLDLIDLVDLVVDGKCNSKLASTVIDVSDKQWKIIRQGKTFIDINKYQ